MWDIQLSLKTGWNYSTWVGICWLGNATWRDRSSINFFEYSCPLSKHKWQSRWKQTFDSYVLLYKISSLHSSTVRSLFMGDKGSNNTRPWRFRFSRSSYRCNAQISAALFRDCELRPPWLSFRATLLPVIALGIRDKVVIFLLLFDKYNLKRFFICYSFFENVHALRDNKKKKKKKEKKRKRKKKKKKKRKKKEKEKKMFLNATTMQWFA